MRKSKVMALDELFLELLEGFMDDVPDASTDIELPGAETEEEKEEEEDFLNRQERITTLAREKAEREFSLLLDGRDENLYEKILEAMLRPSKYGVDRRLWGAIKSILKKSCIETDGKENRAEEFYKLIKGLVGEKAAKKYRLLDPDKEERGRDTVRCNRVESGTRGHAYLVHLDGGWVPEEAYDRHLVNGMKPTSCYYWTRRFYKGRSSYCICFSSLEDQIASDVGLRFIISAIERKAAEVKLMPVEEQAKRLMLLSTKSNGLSEEEAEEISAEKWERHIYKFTISRWNKELQKPENERCFDVNFDMRLRYFYEATIRGDDTEELKENMYPVSDHNLGRRFSDIAYVLYYMEDRVVEEERTFRGYVQSRKTGDYAKSYETKKGIPEKVKKAMEAYSKELFGYVEIDEDCDLELTDTIHKEIKAFCGKFLPNFKLEKAALRFRKLGNHKAVGLYYPFFNCLCVDIRCPSSFVHELGHLIDHQKGSGRLSDKAAFAHVRRLYERNFNTAGKELKGKYDRSYYLDPTEIFARSFEIFISKRIKADICEPDKDLGKEFAYPADEKYREEVERYFNGLLYELGYADEAPLEEAV